MNWRILLAVALACTMAVPATTMASHFSQYTLNPAEHDDMGSSSEPDHAQTSVLGPLVLNHVIDINGDFVAEPDSMFAPGQVLAPGCTDNNGRQQNGLCGAWTVGIGVGKPVGKNLVPPHTPGVGIQGGFGPGITGKGRITVNFLDAKVVADAATVGSTYVDLNKKVADLPVGSVLQANGIGQFIPPGPSALFAWYGTWSDKNGNGVIDMLRDPCKNTDPHCENVMRADNEFVWSGNCLQFGGIPDGNSARCHIDPQASATNGDRFAAYIYPGNHHSTCGGLVESVLAIECGLFPADMPGRQAVGVVDAFTIPVTGLALGSASSIGPGIFGVGNLGFGCNTPFFTDANTGCETDINKADSNDATLFGDNLLGCNTKEEQGCSQFAVQPDQNYDDRTGDHDYQTAMIAYGDGWPTYFYDDSLLEDTVIVSTVGCRQDSTIPQAQDLNTCRFLDVDNYKAWTPGTSDLLTKTIKPAARSEWIFARDRLVPVQSTETEATNTGLIYQNPAGVNAGAVQGSVNDQLQDPGWSREPNTAGDVYPGATRGTCTDAKAQRNGWCNNYAGYEAGSHAWTDAQAFRAEYWSFPLGTIDLGCLQCVEGSTITVGPALNLPHQGGPYSRTLQPGGYNFLGVLGLWHDQKQTWTEDFIDPTAPGNGGPLKVFEVKNTITAAPDGWVGNVVNATGDFRYRGFSPTKCSTENGPGTYEFAVCNPYNDGNVQNPQQAGDTSNGEWRGRCHDNAMTITLHPVNGVWPTVIVFRNHVSEYDLDATGSGGPGDLLAALDTSFSGTSRDIVLGVTCSSGSADSSGFYATSDMIYLPVGNQNVDVQTTLVGHVTLDNGVQETVRDVDYYYGWNA